VASVADLVEPEVLRERAGEYLQRAGEVLRQSAGVRLVEFGPTGVVAVVDDGTARTVRLQSVSGDLTIACDCGTPSWTMFRLVVSDPTFRSPTALCACDS